MMRRLVLVLLPWLCGASCTPERVPLPAPAQAPAASAAPPAQPTSAYSSMYVEKLRARLKDSGPLTLVPELQPVAERSLNATRSAGAVVALDPRDGRVLVLYSITGDRGDPLLTLHQPGSTFKAFSAIAALEAGAIGPTTTLTCTQSYPFGQLTLTCPLAHGPETVSQALAASCNAFFYALAEKQGPKPLRAVADAFGLGERTGIGLDEPAGLLRDPAPDPARPALDLMDAIGHGAYRTNLLGLARAYAAIANGGKLLSLHVSGEARPSTRRVPVSETTLALVREALFDAVGEPHGRSYGDGIDGYPFAGKTGGVDVPGQNGSPSGVVMDSWFVAFAPPAKPTLLVAARLESILPGGPPTAATVVRDVLLAARALDQR